MRSRPGAPLASRFRQCLGVLAGAVLATTLFSQPVGAVDASAPAVDLAALQAQYRRPATIPFPAGNPFSQAKADLGRKLFFDPRLSGAANMSCASCHNPGLSWGDGLPTGVGANAKRLARRSPSILNLAWAEALMWDGRAETLEAQATGPIEEPAEMNQSMSTLLVSLGNLPGYRTAFAAAFPGEPISATTIARAIATFERTVVSGKAPFDRWIEGDTTAIDDAARRGFIAFNTKGNCAACHGGWRFTDDSFHDIGLDSDDPGRGRIVPGVEPLRHAFKTPGLRNIAERGPYMHDGSIKTLPAVVRHYDGGFRQRPSLSDQVYKLNLSERDVGDIVAFLKTLSSVDAPVTVPALPTESID